MANGDTALDFGPFHDLVPEARPAPPLQAAQNAPNNFGPFGDLVPQPRPPLQAAGDYGPFSDLIPRPAPPPPTSTPMSDAAMADTPDPYDVAALAATERRFAVEHPVAYERLQGLGNVISGLVPTSLEQARQMVKPPIQGAAGEENVRQFIQNQQQQNEQWGQAVRGELGPKAQVETILSTALQAAPLLHLPLAESPFVGKKIFTGYTPPEMREPGTAIRPEEVPSASSITSPESVSQPEVRTPVGQETPLRQQGETTPVQPREEPGQPAPPVELPQIDQAAIEPAQPYPLPHQFPEEVAPPVEPVPPVEETPVLPVEEQKTQTPAPKEVTPVEEKTQTQTETVPQTEEVQAPKEGDVGQTQGSPVTPEEQAAAPAPAVKVVSTAIKIGNKVMVGARWDEPHDGIGIRNGIEGKVPQENRGFIVEDANGNKRFVQRMEKDANGNYIAAEAAKASGQVPSTYDGPLYSEGLIQAAGGPSAAGRAAPPTMKVRPLDVLKQIFGQAEKAGQAGYKRGLREGRAEAKTALDELQGQVDNADRWQAGDQETVRQNMVDFVNAVLPKEERGAFINRITQALRRQPLGADPGTIFRRAHDVMESIGDRAKQIWKKDLISQITDLQNKIEKSQGVSVEMKQTARDYFKNLGDLSKMSQEELEAANADAFGMRRTGVLEAKDKIAARRFERDSRLADLANSPTKPAKGFDPIIRDVTPTGWRLFTDRLSNAVLRTLDWASVHEKARLFIPRLFETLDGSKNGWLTRNVYEPLVIRHRAYLQKYNGIAKGAIEIAERNKLKEEDFIRTGIHAHLEQGHPPEEIVKFASDKKAMQARIDDVQQNGLTKGQQELYDYGRKYFDSQLDPMKKFFADHYNKELTTYEKYWPRQIDPRRKLGWMREREQWKHPVTGQIVDVDNAAEGLWSTMDRGQWRTRYVAKGFSKERLPGAEIPVNLNAMETLLTHADNWAYVEQMQPHLNTIGEIANTNMFATKYGRTGGGMVGDYIDALARRGRYSRNLFERTLDGMRNRAMVGTLGFRLNQFKHLANYPLGIANAGGANWFERGFAAAQSDVGKAFLDRVAPEIGQSAGGDISIQEASQLAKGRAKAAFAVDRILDYGNRASTFLGRYFNELDAKGLNWKDFDQIPLDAEALQKARTAYVNAVGSASIIDRPLIVTKGTSIGSKSLGKAVMAYQTPKLVRWGTVRSALVEDAWRSGNYGKAGAKLAITGLGSLMESGVKWGSRAAYTAAGAGILHALGFRSYERKHDIPAKEQLIGEVVSDLASVVPFAGTIVQKAVAIHEYPKAADRILAQTNIPAIDGWIALMTDVGSILTSPSKKAAILQAGGTLAQTVGLPVSTASAVAKETLKQADAKAQHMRDLAELERERGGKKVQRGGGAMVTGRSGQGIRTGFGGQGLTTGRH